MGQTDRPDDRRAAGSRLPSNSESAVKRNHETPKSGIQKRKKIEACPRLSCKIQYLLASNHRDQSTTSEYFTDDDIGRRRTGRREPKRKSVTPKRKRTNFRWPVLGYASC